MKVALVGCGRWGRNILRDLLALGVEVIVVDPDPASGSSASSVTELGPIDGAVVATPIGTHAAVVDQLLPLGVPLFVEKPLTDDPAAAARIAAAAGERVFVMDKWRYHPGVEALAALVRSGELGETRGVRTTRTQPRLANGDDPVWTLAPHDLAIVRELLGSVPAARSARAIPGGLTAELGDRPWVSLEISAAAPLYRREVVLYGSEGTAMLAGPDAGAIEIVRDGAVERRPVSDEQPLLRELRAFLDHLSGGPPPRSSAAEGAETVAIVADLLALARK